MKSVFQYGCEAISEELPKTVMVKSFELGAALLVGYTGIKGITG
jgi:hypothetical protein